MIEIETKYFNYGNRLPVDYIEIGICLFIVILIMLTKISYHKIMNKLYLKTAIQKKSSTNNCQMIMLKIIILFYLSWRTNHFQENSSTIKNNQTNLSRKRWKTIWAHNSSSVSITYSGPQYCNPTSGTCKRGKSKNWSGVLKNIVSGLLYWLNCAQHKYSN